MAPKAMLIDVTMCEGCGECVSACKEANGLPPSDETPTDLSPTNYCALQERGDHYVRRLCMHCQDPTCVSVCPVGAFQKSQEGPVTWDEERCIGCRYCMVACPFGVPRFEWDSANPKVTKCIFCAERWKKGEIPACADNCPAEATIVGDRDEILAEAHRRIKENPDDYHPEVYGETVVGGTSIFYLSAVPFGELGLPTDLPKEPLPPLTGRVLSKLPGVILVGGTFLFGMHWLTKRKNAIAAAEAGEEEAH